MSGPSRLRVLMSGVPAGWLSRASTGRVELVYDPGYAVAGATPLSTGMPVLATRHTGRHLNAWLANLLPDNELVLARWAARFQVSASSPFALLAKVKPATKRPPGSPAGVPLSRALGVEGIPARTLRDVSRAPGTSPARRSLVWHS